MYIALAPRDVNPACQDMRDGLIVQSLAFAAIESQSVSFFSRIPFFIIYSEVGKADDYSILGGSKVSTANCHLPRQSPKHFSSALLEACRTKLRLYTRNPPRGLSGSTRWPR